ncbi:MAG: hypothetical protein JWL76_2152 [Thermoleophilia bacterium]|nr:hypothetical protein [Thermoleophilia bacterium]
MSVSINTRRTPRRHETNRALRQRAVAAGIDPFVAGTTAPDDLAAVIRLAPALRLVPDVELPFEVEPEDLCPNLRFDPYADGPDEAISTRIARGIEHGKPIGHLLNHPHFNGFGGDAA